MRPFAFPAAGLDSFLLWAAELGASDIAVQTGAPAFIEVDGALRRASGAVLDGVVMGRLCARVFDDTGEGILRSGRAIDCSYAVASGKRRFRRFRCNLSPVLADQRFGINLTMRVLPDAATHPGGVGHRGGDRRRLGPLPGSHAGDRSAGFRQVDPAGCGHTAPAREWRGACAVIRGADRVRLRRHRRRRRADVIVGDSAPLPELCGGTAREPEAAACGGGGGRGAGPGDGGGGGARRRLRHRRVRHRPHRRRRRGHSPPAGGVPRAGAARAGCCADRRHDARGDPDAAGEPARGGAPPSASGSSSTARSRRRSWRRRRNAGRV